MRDTVVLIPAAGRGERLGPGVPKAMRELGGEPLLAHAVRRMAAAPSVAHIVVAAPSGLEGQVRLLLKERDHAAVTVVTGGSDRPSSVAAALAAAPAECDIVLVHDAARPLAPAALAERVAAAVRAGHDAVIPAQPAVDTVKQVDLEGQVLATPDRASLRLVQTPQGFRRPVLVAAHAAHGDVVATDDAAMVERLGVKVHTVPGSSQAFKVTMPFDFAVAELMLEREL
ncbi:MAG: 2-C-methyl-D-erythritol 4-phosphate cytidylyltransferase [Micromonosporaceae bacterium]